MLPSYYILFRSVYIKNTLDFKRNIFQGFNNHQMSSFVPMLWKLYHLYSFRFLHILLLPVKFVLLIVYHAIPLQRPVFSFCKQAVLKFTLIRKSCLFVKTDGSFIVA